jgi:hypothetical protein
MNNLAWQAGKNLKRSVEQSGRVMNINHWIVALWMLAQEEGVGLDEIVTRLIAASDFAPAPTNKDEIRRQLGY